LNLLSVEGDVAPIAGDCQVSSLQRIPRFLMTSQRKSRRAEALYIVASIALGPSGPSGELTQVVIRMAVGAILESSQTRGYAAGMTALTPGLLVSALEGEAGATVIEATYLDGAPTALGMALQTRRAQALFVRIPMAIGTVRERQSDVFDKAGGVGGRCIPRIRGVASIASDLNVSSHQWITSGLVSEEVSLGPLLDSVAGLAGPILELASMLVLMTGETRRPVEAQKRPVQVLSSLLESALGANQRLLMTAPASQFPVSPLQLE